MRSIALVLSVTFAGLAMTPLPADHAVLRGFSPNPPRFNSIGRRNSARSRNPHGCATQCNGSPRVRITSDRRTTRTNAEWIRGQFRATDGRPTSRPSTCSSRRRRERVVELVAPTRFVAKLQEPDARRRSDVESEGRAAADVQRLLDRRRRHRAARLRQLRHPRRLRRARAPRHLGEGRDRHRALRRLVARHQAESRGRAWRDRLPHLLRSARRRLRRRRRLPERSDAPARRRAARLASPTCRLYPGDPLTPGVGATKDAKRLAARRGDTTITKIPVLPISYGDAQPLLAALGGPLAPNRGAAACRSRIASARARARFISRSSRLDAEAALRRHRDDSRHAPSRTSG